MTPFSIPSQSRVHHWRKSQLLLFAYSLVSTDLQNMSFKKNVATYLFESPCFFY